MKLFIIVVVLFFVVITFLEFTPGDNLANTYCAKRAQEETRRVRNNGMRFRDRATEKENFDICMEQFDNPTLGDVILVFFDRGEKAQGILE